MLRTTHPFLKSHPQPPKPPSDLSASTFDQPNVPEDSPRTKPNLESLPQDILLRIITHLHDIGSHHTQALAQTCCRLAAAVRTITRRGDIALPTNLARRIFYPALGVDMTSRGRRAGVTLRKNSLPGDAFVVFDRCVTGTSAFWRFRIDQFKGQRIDVGVAMPHAFRFATVERKASWSFDCFGRVSLAGQRHAYGRQMKEGDILGVLYDAKTNSLSFLDNGVCMGVVPLVGLGAKAHLLPFVYLPYHEGESVTLLQGGEPLSVMAVRAGAQRWRKPAGLPYDGSIIVQTWDARVWYAIRVDPKVTTLAHLWHMLEERHGVARHLFELIHEGTRLTYSHRLTLSDVGITINERTGTCKNDILLSVPHIVS